MLTKDEALKRLAQQVARVPALQELDRDSPEFRKWSRDTEVLIEQIFGSDTRHLVRLCQIVGNVREIALSHFVRRQHQS
jgi:hypothetical protein